jgi:hypothetical protein
MIADIGPQIWILVGKLLVAGGGGAVVAFAIFKFLGKSWIEHQLAKELETAKAEISILAARRLKLHDREYVVFPELWDKLNRAFNSLDRAIISLRHVPIFWKMPEAKLNDWMNHSDLSDDEKSYFLSEEDKSQAYGKILDWRDLIDAQKHSIEFHTYFQSNRIFISPEIKGKFNQIDTLIHEALVAKKMDSNGYSGESKNYLIEALDKFDKQVKPLMVDIESLVQTRLFPERRSGAMARAKK